MADEKKPDLPMSEGDIKRTIQRSRDDMAEAGIYIAPRGRPFGIADLITAMVRDLGRFGGTKLIELVEADPGNNVEQRARLTVQLYTANNIFTIDAYQPHPDARSHRHFYLGCMATARRMRPGESWRRGNDLADGPLSLETWERIKADILSYEFNEVVTSRSLADPRNVIRLHEAGMAYTEVDE